MAVEEDASGEGVGNVWDILEADKGEKGLSEVAVLGDVD